MPITAVDSISPAFQHTKEQLFQPFRFGQWTRLALVGLLAGELNSGGCHFQMPSTGGGGGHHDSFAGPNVNPALLIPLVIIAVIAIPVLWLLILYVSSRMRFVLFDSVIEKNCAIRRMWHARRGPGLQYFVWQLLFSVVTFAGFAVIVGIPALIAFSLGWFTDPRAHLPGVILLGALVFFVFLAWILLIVVVHVFTKDFVVPQMALENVSAFEGWARLLKMLKAEQARYAGYAGMKLVLAIGAAFVIGVLAMILIIAILIPIGGLGAISILIGQAAGLTWNVFTITLAVVIGCMVLLVLLYGVSLIAVPAIVFFPAYAIYFFAARYPLLANVLYPPPPPPVLPVPEPTG